MSDIFTSASSSQGASLDTAGAVRALAGIVLSDNSFEEVLRRTTEVAKRALGAADVSVTLHERDPVTVASSGPLAQRADSMQYSNGDGPCLEALRSGVIITVHDQSRDERWPGYARQALTEGIASSLSVPLGMDGRWIGAFNCYATIPNMFGDEVAAAAKDLAGYAAVVVGNADLYFSAAAKAAQLEQAMASRAIIEQAKGVLMGARRCSADDAFAILVRLSQQSHRKLRDVASALVAEATG